MEAFFELILGIFTFPLLNVLPLLVVFLWWARIAKNGYKL